MKSVESSLRKATMMESTDSAVAERGINATMFNHMLQEVTHLRSESQRMRDELIVANEQVRVQTERIDQLGNAMDEIMKYVQQLCLTKQGVPASNTDAELESLGQTGLSLGGLPASGNTPANEAPLQARQGPMDMTGKYINIEGVEHDLSLARGFFDPEAVDSNGTSFASVDSRGDDIENDVCVSRPHNYECHRTIMSTLATQFAPSLGCQSDFIQLKESEDCLDLAAGLYDNLDNAAMDVVGNLGNAAIDVADEDSPCPWNRKPSDVMCIPSTKLAQSLALPCGDSDHEGNGTTAGGNRTSRRIADMIENESHGFHHDKRDTCVSEEADEIKKRSTGIVLDFSTEIRAAPIPTIAATTAMIRNIACRYCREDVMMVLDMEGFHGKYDYVNVPTSPASNKYKSKKLSNLGYCFVNFTHSRYLVECVERFDGKCFGNSMSKKVCRVSFANCQGSEHPRDMSSEYISTDFALAC